MLIASPPRGMRSFFLPSCFTRERAEGRSDDQRHTYVRTYARTSVQGGPRLAPRRWQLFFCFRFVAPLAASCLTIRTPRHGFFKDGACSRGGRVGYSSGCNIWGASCGCLFDRGQDGTFFCSSLAHALGLSRQASESLLLSQKGVWRVRRPVSGASKEILISGGLPSQTWLVCWGSKRPHPSAKHVGNRWGASPPPTFSRGGEPFRAPNLGGRTDMLTNRSHRAPPNFWPPC